VTVLFFATDIHGSEICWKKFINAGKFYGANVLILGGDITGKAIVPIVHYGNNTYQAELLEHVTILHGSAEVQDMVKRIRSRGYYPYLTNPDEIKILHENPERVNQLFKNEVLRCVEQWLTFAEEKLANTGITCYVSPGNDDMFEIDELIRAARSVRLAEGEVVALDETHEMISTGWSNPTPWHSFREESEEKLAIRLENMASRLKNPAMSVFNIHVPPFESSLDDAPELTKDFRPKYAGNSLVPVGSRAVRELIKKYQPLLGLFGHIHENKAAIRMGKTLCINPGSMYEQGTLLGALVTLDRKKITNYILTTG